MVKFSQHIEIILVAVAAAHGVRPEQIIFTDVAAKNEHIRRSALADLFLDTYVNPDILQLIHAFGFNISVGAVVGNKLLQWPLLCCTLADHEQT